MEQEPALEPAQATFPRLLPQHLPWPGRERDHFPPPPAVLLRDAVTEQFLPLPAIPRLLPAVPSPFPTAPSHSQPSPGWFKKAQEWLAKAARCQ